MYSEIKNLKLTKNPFLLFLPFLILYLVLILIFATNEVSRDDQGRFLIYAQNLLHGFYSPPPPNIDLGNGPGYPILLVPFIALRLPLIYMQLMNAVFYYLSIVFLFKSMQQIVSFRISIVFSLLWALYFTFYEQMTHVLPEVFAQSLIPVLIFCVIKAFNNHDSKTKKQYLFFSGFIFGYMALTKPVFGYVLMVMIVGMGLLWVANRKSMHFKRSMIILLIAFATTIPYLAYTYHLTGKMLYWSSFGGNNLYWMSTPYEDETGSWVAYPYNPNLKETIPGSSALIQARHKKDLDEILKYTGTEQDDAFKKIAIKNIETYPLKFLKNCFSNAGRMLFNFPYTYETQKTGTLLRLPTNGTILVFALFCLIPTLVSWRRILFSIRFMLFIALLYFGGSLLGSAESRMFAIIVPILFIWIAYIIQRSLKVKLQIE